MADNRNVLSRKPMPRPKPENVLQQILAAAARQRGFQGGPQDARQTEQLHLRSLMQMQDPARFQSLQRRGFDPMQGGAEYSLPSGEAELTTAAVDPSMQTPGYVVRSQAPQMIDQNEAMRHDLLMRSLRSDRGWGQAKRNEADDAALRARLEHLKVAPVPADYGDGDFSDKRKLINALLWATGQGGGMR